MSEALVIAGGRLIDGTGAQPRDDVTVVIAGPRIVNVGPSAETAVPAGARVLDARGRTVLPGLIDLHQHTLHSWDKTLFPKNGITSVRFAGGVQREILELRERIRSGQLLGPRIFSVGPTIDLPPTARPESALIVSGPDEARRQAERLILEEKVDALFVARRVDEPTLCAVLEVAHHYGRPVTGQVFALSGRRAAELGIDGLENTSRIPESPAIDDATLHRYRSAPHRVGMTGRLWATAPQAMMEEILGVMAERGVEWAPGVVSFECWAGFLDEALKADPDYQAAPSDLLRAYWDFQAAAQDGWDAEVMANLAAGVERMVHWIGYYHRIGGPIVTGTDTQLGAITYHRELGHLRAAGLSPLEVLVAATSRSARALRRADLGVVAPGALADLIVVEDDPLRDLGVLRRPVHVVIGGRVEIREHQARDLMDASGGGNAGQD